MASNSQILAEFQSHLHNLASKEKLFHFGQSTTNDIGFRSGNVRTGGRCKRSGPGGMRYWPMGTKGGEGHNPPTLSPHVGMLRGA